MRQFATFIAGLCISINHAAGTPQPIVSSNSPGCTSIREILVSDSELPAAKTFCSSFLHLTSTSTVSTTVTPTTTVTVTSTRTISTVSVRQTSSLTITSTFTANSTVYVTTPTVATSVTTVPLTQCGAATPNKRAVNKPVSTPSALKSLASQYGWGNAQYSSACNCFPTTPATITVTRTASASTVSKTTTVNVRHSTTATTTQQFTTTVTTTAGRTTSTVASTTTTTVTATGPIRFGNGEANYAECDTRSDRGFFNCFLGTGTGDQFYIQPDGSVLDGTLGYPLGNGVSGLLAISYTGQVNAALSGFAQTYMTCSIADSGTSGACAATCTGGTHDTSYDCSSGGWALATSGQYALSGCNAFDLIAYST